MPSGHLYLPQLVDAYARSAKLNVPGPKGEPPTPIAAVDYAAKQVNWTFKTDEKGAKQLADATDAAKALARDERLAPGIERTLTGLHALHDARKGAAGIGELKMATDEAGFVANRSMTLVDNHFDKFEYKNLEEAYAGGEAFAAQAEKELPRGAVFSGKALDLAPAHTATLKKAWEGKKPLTPEEVFRFGKDVARELERAVTPLPPESSVKPEFQWYEDSTIDVLHAWTGNIAATAKAAGLEADPKALAKLEGAYRGEMLQVPENQALVKVLDLAGIDAANPEHRSRATGLLQDVTLDAVPASLAGGIIEARHLPPDKADWLTGRLLDLGGRPGNVDGLRAELEKIPPIKPRG